MEGGCELPKSSPVVGKYFDNKLVVVKGRDKLKFYKLIEETNVINMYTTCCQTYLMRIHPGYMHTTVAVLFHESYPPTRFTNMADQDPYIRFFPSHFSEEQRKSLSHGDILEVWRDERDKMEGRGDGWEEKYRFFIEKITSPIPDGLEGESFQQIVEERGNGVLVMGWQSGRFAKKTVVVYGKNDHWFPLDR